MTRELPDQQFHNGFLVKADVETIACEEENISPYSLPQEVLSYVPPPDAIITHFKNGDRERKLHNNIELEPHEIEQVRALQEESKAHNAAFSPSVISLATRFMSRARGDPKRGMKLMQATQEWRDEFFKKGPLVAKELKEDFSHGVVYFCGRDKDLRPLLIVRAIRIPDKWYKEKAIDKLINLLIFCMEYFIRYMVVPGKIENLNLIADLKGLGVTQVPITALAEVNRIMSNHYLGRVFKFYIVNLSWMLSSIAGIAKALLTDRQKQKLNILDKVQELANEAAPHQLEEDLGGARPVLDVFFPFPFRPGPFEASLALKENTSAIPDVHRLLTRRGAQGRIWDPSLSREDNLKLEYTPQAEDILKRCGLPFLCSTPETIPQEGPSKTVGSGSTDAVIVSPIGTSSSLGGFSASSGTGRTQVACSFVRTIPSRSRSVEQTVQERTIEEAHVAPASWWSCRPCCYGPSRPTA